MFKFKDFEGVMDTYLLERGCEERAKGGAFIDSAEKTFIEIVYRVSEEEDEFQLIYFMFYCKVFQICLDC